MPAYLHTSQVYCDRSFATYSLHIAAKLILFECNKASCLFTKTSLFKLAWPAAWSTRLFRALPLRSEPCQVQCCRHIETANLESKLCLSRWRLIFDLSFVLDANLGTLLPRFLLLLLWYWTLPLRTRGRLRLFFVFVFLAIVF